MADNMRIWDAVSKTDPKTTKRVNQRGGFTAIDAQAQIESATRRFGPVGEGWGYSPGAPIFHENLVFIQVTLWHGDRNNSFGPETGGAEWKDKNGRLDSDCAKKATTDALTKLLSRLGFNADVFLGKFDDSKYVEQMEREFSQPRTPDPEAKINDKTRDALAALIAGDGSDVATFCRENNLTTLKELTNGRAAELAGPMKQRQKEKETTNA